jgi:hypothetical protein
MNDYFPIKIDNITLKVKRLNFKNYSAAYEIWKKDSIQFILVHDAKRRENHAWNIEHGESSNVSQEYIDKIAGAIDFHNVP